LRDLQWIDLREDWNDGIKRLLDTSTVTDFL